MAEPAPKARSNKRNKDGERLRRGILRAQEKGKPRKADFRQRAHCNPLSQVGSFEDPKNVDEMDWSEHFPKLLEKGQKVEMADVGCGFGGLLVALSPMFPKSAIIGFEIRIKVKEFVRLRIESLRNDNPDEFDNVSVIRTNAMMSLPKFFRKAQLSKMFICFPDPQFKPKNHRRRIINRALLTDFSFFLKQGGLLYTITDVKEYHEWVIAHCDAHPCFERLPEEEALADPVLETVRTATEEGKKVERNKGDKWTAIYRRIAPPEEPCWEFKTDTGIYE